MKSFIFSLMSLIVLFSPQCVKGDIFPEFSPKPIRIRFTVPSSPWTGELEKRNKSLIFEHSIEGQVFMNHKGKITIDGFSGKTDRITPWQTLTELINTYKSADIEKVSALYVSTHRKAIRATYTDPEVGPSQIEFMKSISGGELLISIKQPYGILALVRLSTLSGSTIMPFAFALENGGYFAYGEYSINEDLIAELLNFLHTKSPDEIEILQP